MAEREARIGDTLMFRTRAARRPGEAPELFRLFFEARSRPFREVGIGLFLNDRAKDVRLKVADIAPRTGVDYWTVLRVKSGLFDMDADVEAVEKIAYTLFTDLRELLRIDHEAIARKAKEEGSDWGHKILMGYLKQDQIVNRERYRNSSMIGTASRMTRTMKGFGKVQQEIDRKDLERSTQVDERWIEFLEHGNVPEEALYPTIDRLAKAYGTNPAMLLRHGEDIMEYIYQNRRSFDREDFEEVRALVAYWNGLTKI